MENFILLNGRLMIDEKNEGNPGLTCFSFSLVGLCFKVFMKISK